MRDQPPSVQDGKWGMQPGEVSNLEKAERPSSTKLGGSEAVRVAREAWNGSTNWVNASRRAAWSNSLRAFQSLHPLSSKYNSGAYTHRSSLYRPKTRAMVRRDEAATASAFFSNEDVVSIQAADDDDPFQQASAELIKALLQYRLTKTIPWFLTIVGARQDCDVMGVCAAKAYWKYEEKHIRDEKRFSLGPDGMLATEADGSLAFETFEITEKLHDKPVVDLIAPENIRIDAAADWRDPIKSSPFVIEAVPMYLQDVEDKIAEGEWFEVSSSALRASAELSDDATRRSREHGRVPGKDDDAWKPQPFTTCWVQENIIRWRGEDWHYFTLAGGGELLTEPRPLKEVYLHGERPYVLGSVIVEAHKTFPSGKVELTRDLQWAANDDWNLRFDQLKMALNPRQLVKSGASVDLSDLRTFIPGKSILVKDPTSDVVWDRPPPPAAEAYAEQDRINLDFDELTGAFSNSSVQASQINQQSATGMHLMSGEAAGLTEYELRVFAETFVEPLIGLLIKLEQAYETDPIIMTLAGKKAQLLQKFGINGITDELLAQEVTTKVNVGIGATNPSLKMRNIAMAGQMLSSLFGPTLMMGLNFGEVCKEIFGLAGYKDGSRFFQEGFDPKQAMQQAQQAKNAPKPPDPSKVQAAQVQTQGKMEETKLKGQVDKELALIDLQAQRENDQAENFRAILKAQQAQMGQQVRAAMRGPEVHPVLAELGV